MDNTLDPHTSTLLGRYLLGDAPPEVIEELRSARSSNPRLGEVMQLLELTDPSYETSPVGHKGGETMKDLTLPDYLNAERLARAYSLDRRTVKRLLLGSLIFVALGIQTLLLGKGTLAFVVGMLNAVGVPLLVAIMLLVLPAHYRKKARAIAEGGDAWRSAVEGAQRLERFSFGPWQRLLTVLGIVLALVGYGLLFASVLRPGDGMNWWAAALAGVGSGIAAAMFGYRSAAQRIRHNS